MVKQLITSVILINVLELSLNVDTNFLVMILMTVSVPMRLQVVRVQRGSQTVMILVFMLLMDGVKGFQLIKFKKKLQEKKNQQQFKKKQPKVDLNKINLKKKSNNNQKMNLFKIKSLILQKPLKMKFMTMITKLCRRKKVQSLFS